MNIISFSAKERKARLETGQAVCTSVLLCAFVHSWEDVLSNS